MLFSTVFASGALLAGSALAAPAEAPRAVEVPESIANATALGIDLYGAIPSDAVKKDDHWTAEPGTLAAAWIRAQLDLPAYEDAQEAAGVAVEKREWANIGIGIFAQDWCTGQASWFDNVQYDVAHVDSVNMFSFGISYRGLRSNEQLDFSRRSGGDLCGAYVTSRFGGTPIGCQNIAQVNCFRLWHW